MRRFTALTALLTSLTFATTALACPVCDSDTGQEVRDGIFNEDFLTDAAAVLLPVPVLIGIVMAIHYGLPFAWRRREKPSASPRRGRR